MEKATPLYRGNSRTELTVAERDALKRGGFLLEPEEWGGDDPLAQTEAEYRAMLRDGCLSVEEAAARLGLSSENVLRSLTSQPPALYGVRVDSGWRIPDFQLDGERLLPGLSGVVGRLDAELHPLSVLRWFTLPNPDLVLGESEDPVSPREWLRLGFSPDPVAELAADL